MTASDASDLSNLKISSSDLDSVNIQVYNDLSSAADTITAKSIKIKEGEKSVTLAAAQPTSTQLPAFDHAKFTKMVAEKGEGNDLDVIVNVRS